MRAVKILDSTLRDGAQAGGISFSVGDKMKIARVLDDFGVSYIEAGNPASNPKDAEFFRRSGELSLKNAKLTAFGATRRGGVKAEDDAGLAALLAANTGCAAIFGKSWDFHATDILRVTLGENLKMIEDSINFLKSKNREVIFDAEHFFDGFKNNAEYALECVKAAKSADVICLCDTNGGAFPEEIERAVVAARRALPDKEIGIHCHNDASLASANTLFAVEAGASHVQGTFIGFGERSGNCALTSVIPNLQIKRGYDCVPDVSKLTETARFIAEIANVPLSEREPFVGANAFTHKAGMHIDGVNKSPASFEQIEPSSVGNERRILMSDAAGRGAVLDKIRQVDPSVNKDDAAAAKIVEKLKELESGGYQFEAAEGGFELVIRKQLGKYRPFFELVSFKVMGELPYKEGESASALIKIKVGGVEEITAAEGDGPVNALDKALRKALEVFYPTLKSTRLVDYKVRVLDGAATAAKVRVLIESTDGENSWTTVGVSTDIIEASWLALVDSLEYKLIRESE